MRTPLVRFCLVNGTRSCNDVMMNHDPHYEYESFNHRHQVNAVSCERGRVSVDNREIKFKHQSPTKVHYDGAAVGDDGYVNDDGDDDDGYGNDVPVVYPGIIIVLMMIVIMMTADTAESMMMMILMLKTFM